VKLNSLAKAIPLQRTEKEKFEKKLDQRKLSSYYIELFSSVNISLVLERREGKKT